jgi:hypothetical protein
MMSKVKIPLKIGDIKGKRVHIYVEEMPNEKLRITSDKYDILTDERFCYDNKIRVIIRKKDYRAMKLKLTKYFESCFLLKLAGDKNENIDSGHKNSDGGKNKKSIAKQSSTRNSSAVRFGTRGGVETKNFGGKSKANNLDKASDTKTSDEDKEGS